MILMIQKFHFELLNLNLIKNIFDSILLISKNDKTFIDTRHLYIHPLCPFSRWTVSMHTNVPARLPQLITHQFVLYQNTRLSILQCRRANSTAATWSPMKIPAEQWFPKRNGYQSSSECVTDIVLFRIIMMQRDPFEKIQTTKKLFDAKRDVFSRKTSQLSNE